MVINEAEMIQSLTQLSSQVNQAVQAGNLPSYNDQIIMKLKQTLDFLNLREAVSNADTLAKDFFTLGYKLAQQLLPKCVDDQFIQCAAFGALYREQHKVIKAPANAAPSAEYLPIPSHEIAVLLPLFIKFVRIGEENDGLAKLHTYDMDRGIYSSDSWFIDRFIDAMQAGVTEKSAKEIRRWMDQHADFKQPTKNSNLTVMGNGIFDMVSKQLKPFTDEYIFTTKISVNFNPNAQHPQFQTNWTWDQFCNDQFPDPADKFMAWQLIQYTLLTNMAKGVYVYLYDPMGNTGKSMFAKILRNMVGDRNYGMANLKQFDTNRFITATIYDKCFIYGDENDASYVQFNDLMKSMSTGESITVEYKGKDIFSASVTPMIIQSMNSTPVFKQIDGGTKRRMRILEFKKSYTGVENKEIKLNNIQNQEFLEWLAYNALMMDLSGFADSPNSIRIKGEIERESNPVLEYATDKFSRFTGDVIPIWLAFADFQVWLNQENKNTTRTKIRFTKELKLILSQHGWVVPEYPIRMSKFLESDYQLFFEDYLQTNHNSAERFLAFSQESQRFKRAHKSFARNDAASI